MEELLIVSGASGKLGAAFVRALVAHGKRVVALSRRDTESEAETVFIGDLLDESATEDLVRSISLPEEGLVTLIHTVGKFKFEGIEGSITDKDGDGIDDEVYRTNVLTLKNLVKPLLERAGAGRLHVCAFASVSDRHDVPFWSSYTRAKNIVRGYLKSLWEAGRLRALVVNVSTVDTGNENALRPEADKTYWLSPEEIVARTLPKLATLDAYKEIDVVKEKPGFRDDYYIDHDSLLKKWRKEMGHES